MEKQKIFNDFALLKEESINRILILKLKRNEYQITLAKEDNIANKNADYIYGFTQSVNDDDIVINKNKSIQEQMITLIHEMLHLIYPYAPEEEVEEAGVRLYDYLTENQFDFLYAYLGSLPLWKKGC